MQQPLKHMVVIHFLGNSGLLIFLIREELWFVRRVLSSVCFSLTVLCCITMCCEDRLYDLSSPLHPPPKKGGGGSGEEGKDILVGCQKRVKRICINVQLFLMAYSPDDSTAGVTNHFSSISHFRYTFFTGAPIAGSAVNQVEQIVGYVSIGYPFGLLASILFGQHHKNVLKSPKPKLFIMGTQDGFTSIKQLNNKLKCAAGRVEKHLIEGIGHFELEGPAYDSHMVNLIVEFIDSV